VIRFLVDANVVLDVLIERAPHLSASGAVWLAAETGHIEAFLSAHAVTTIDYVVCKEVGRPHANHMLSRLLAVFSVAPVDSAILRTALDWKWGDFEDAVTAAAAQKAACDGIVTRDADGFARSPVRILTPEAAISMIRAPVNPTHTRHKSK
jgi:predicted nucleic acid-binding protein